MVVLMESLGVEKRDVVRGSRQIGLMVTDGDSILIDPHGGEEEGGREG